MKPKITTSETPTIIVVLGATGDLIKKKVIPSICYLSMHKRLPSRFRVIGMARREMTDDDFRSHVQTQIKERLGDVGTKTLHDVASLFTYHQGNFNDVQSFEALKAKLEDMDLAWGVCSNKIFYLAVPPDQFETIISHLARVGLNIPCGGKLGWTRVLIEKPFGEDAPSARSLFALLERSFKEEQLYLIDHYLAKDLVQAIRYFRFSNNLFEKSWNKDSIERIDIRLLETLGAEDRGAFYDKVGAFRDVGQNHLLQMLAVITMDATKDMAAFHVRQQRADIMKSLKTWTPESLRTQTFRAQYEGFRQVPKVSPESSTETYFKLQTELTHPRWAGVTVTLESGKRFAVAKKDVVVTFKKTDQCLACSPERMEHNRVVFSIEPDERISIHFWTKKPGFELELEERTFDFFLYQNEKKVQYVEEYAELIFNCLIGDQSDFVSKEEVMAQWTFTDPVIAAWKENRVALNFYAPESEAVEASIVGVGPACQVKKISKELAIVGLGKMGAGMARRMAEQGWRVVGFNRSPEATQELAKDGIVPAFTLTEMVSLLSASPKVVWLMVPAGKPVDDVLFGKQGLVSLLKKGDMVIDGGNSFYKDTVERSKKLANYGIRFLDCGTSGGPLGARHGACLMVGGERRDFEFMEQLFLDFALPQGYEFFDGAGAGHFVKMIHNGIEYGMMQAIAEGFSLLKESQYRLNLTRVCDIYNHGSVIQSRLVSWLKDAFELYGENLKPISGSVQHSGEGAWTVKTAAEMNIAVPVIQNALLFRELSEKDPTYTGQIVSALRGQFGHHPVLKTDKQ